MEESTMAIDYGAVLADLRQRRMKLDQAIAAIEDIIGVAPAPAAGAVAPVRQDEFAAMTVSEAAQSVLRKTGRPLGAGDIARALERGGYETGSKNFYNTVYGTLQREHERGIFTKDGNKWGLSEWRRPSFSGASVQALAKALEATNPQRDSANEPQPLSARFPDAVQG